MRIYGNNALKEGQAGDEKAEFQRRLPYAPSPFFPDEWEKGTRYEDVMRQDAAGRRLSEKIAEQTAQAHQNRVYQMMEAAGRTLLGILGVAAAAFLLWLLVSWIDVCCHNDPFIEDGEPHSWNAFVVMTDGRR